jgi:NAD-dependent deacetylase
MVSQVAAAEPNEGHTGLARLEELGILHTVITQNLDGLHQQAGNTDVIEFHGTFASFFCMDCLRKTTIEILDLSISPPRCDCGGIFRPDCVFFGEAIPSLALQRSHEIAATCDIMLVVGTSAEVQPAAYIPAVAKSSGAKIIEINPESTPLTGSVGDIFLKGKAGHIMKRLVDEIIALNRSGNL